MTYFSFLAIFILPPIIVLSLITYWDNQRGRKAPPSLQTWPLWLVISGHILVAVLYTTPWDNYLVATAVWWYDPQRVTGVVLGWVPIEEYTFFIVQTLLTGLWLGVLARRLRISAMSSHRHFLSLSSRLWTMIIPGMFWLWSLYILIIAWQPATYLALILIWALPPIMFQLGFGADILWHYRALVLLGLIPTTLYLSVADMVAIEQGVWTISPMQTLGFHLGVLPIEEAAFFLMTNLLICFGILLVLAQESQSRAGERVKNFLRAFVRST